MSTLAELERAYRSANQLVDRLRFLSRQRGVDQERKAKYERQLVHALEARRAALGRLQAARVWKR